MPSERKEDSGVPGARASAERTWDSGERRRDNDEPSGRVSDVQNMKSARRVTANLDESDANKR